MKELLVLKNKISNEDIEIIESSLRVLKSHDKKKFIQTINRMKLIFIEIDDIQILNKISLIFSAFSIHSSVPILIGKLISGKYDNNGGTLVYSLKGLKFLDYKEELSYLWEKNISYEMKEMLKLINIYPPPAA
ncbi:MAG TPA: hypothetical protein P5531_12720 [Bacteroidales bacterium]|nr:hypothetical protein [Bacteroidales bacterium]HSA44444.1 hypothetical protein [Bacteroidales bacterium]